MVSRIQLPTDEDDSKEEGGSNVLLMKAPTMNNYMNNFQPEKSMDGNTLEKAMDGNTSEGRGWERTREGLGWE